MLEKIVFTMIGRVQEMHQGIPRETIYVCDKENMLKNADVLMTLLLEIGRVHLPGPGMWNLLQSCGIFSHANTLQQTMFDRIMMTYGDAERESTLNAYVSSSKL